MANASWAAAVAPWRGALERRHSPGRRAKIRAVTGAAPEPAGGLKALCRPSQTVPPAAFNSAARRQQRQATRSNRPIARMIRRHTCPTWQTVFRHGGNSLRSLPRSQRACARSSGSGKGGLAAGANLPCSPSTRFAISAIRTVMSERKPRSGSGSRDGNLDVSKKNNVPDA